MKRILISLVISILFCVTSFAQIKTFTKQGESVVQKDQSVNQVIAYLKQKLTREAQEEAGTFITTNLKIDNYQITKDEFTSFAGSISKATVLEENSFMKNAEQYVKVKIKVNIDTDNVKAYLEKIMQDNEYKEQAQKAIKEAEELKKKNLELENKLKTATKQEYEQKLLLETERHIQQQKQREIELNKMALDAREEYIKIKNKQKKQDLLRQEETNALKKKIELDEIELKKKIEQETDNIKKYEFENQQRIMQLENDAKKNLIKFNKKSSLSIEDTIKEVNNLKVEINKIVADFDNLFQTNKVNIEDSYNKQLEIIKNRSFLEKEPIKGEYDKYEETKEFQNRLAAYRKKKTLFKIENKNIILNLKEQKKKEIIDHEIETISSMVKAAQPFIEKIKHYQNQEFHNINIEYIKPSTATINVDIKKLTIFFKYQGINYSYKIDYLKKEDGIVMYETYTRFVIQPYYTIKNESYINYNKHRSKNEKTVGRNGNIYKPLLLGFKITHLGTESSYYYELTKRPKTFDIAFYEPIQKYSQNYNKKLNEFITKEQMNIIRYKNKYSTSK